ncbi:hypothetical protein FB567DRAFT_8870 [Paraphoma chrysanthemicola]|uniref:Uncharacterized protein n=1 Tax=Paraphoma chrysanthemicola TaxID=798071 RepID=A0A8K0RK17_9PLEO|nr:hypothetical protein FB567DRAFT_8870 [Paraphoma chrysanthemicola]
MRLCYQEHGTFHYSAAAGPFRCMMDTGSTLAFIAAKSVDLQVDQLSGTVTWADAICRMPSENASDTQQAHSMHLDTIRSTASARLRSVIDYSIDYLVSFDSTAIRTFNDAWSRCSSSDLAHRARWEAPTGEPARRFPESTSLIAPMIHMTAVERLKRSSIVYLELLSAFLPPLKRVNSSASRRRQPGRSLLVPLPIDSVRVVCYCVTARLSCRTLRLRCFRTRGPLRCIARF